MIDIALRNLAARKTRSIFCIAGVMICVFLIGTVDGMLNQMHEEMTGDLARYMGKMYLQQPGVGYPPFASVISENIANEVLARNDLNLDESTPLLLLVIEPADNPMDPANIFAVGITPGKEKAYLVNIRASSGKDTLEGEIENAVILGWGAASRYKASVGEEIIIRGEICRVIGVLEETKILNIDRAVLMSISFAQSAFGREGTVSVVLLTAKDIEEVQKIASDLVEKYPDFEVATQEDMQKNAEKMMEMPNQFMGMISMVIFLAAVVMVINVMMMAVRERTREIGILRAIGAGKRVVLTTILFETLILGLVGGILGIALTILGAHLLNWTWILSQQEMIKIFVIATVIGTLSGLYPAYRATRVNPLEALRYE